MGNNGMTERRFSPYSDNGGSVVAIAGDDFVVIASDTRLSGHGYAILSREQPKLFKLSDSTVLGTTGCWCDILTFCKVAEMRLKTYRHTHNRPMTTPAVAQMTATMLYHKRFFPYYISNILAGLDLEGRGWSTAMTLSATARGICTVPGAPPCPCCSPSWTTRWASRI